MTIKDFPAGAVVATASTRRKAQLLAQNPGLVVVEIRGNVATRMQKLAEQPGLDATILAAAGMKRLGFDIEPGGRITGEGIPDGLLATLLEPEVMLPCVGQGALGIEIRENDERLAAICARLNDCNTQLCVTAERAFLAAMGGGCQSPVGAFAEIAGNEIRLRAVSFQDDQVRSGEAKRPVGEAAELGRELAGKLKL
jgi:hydroxymethylbilane synthase